MKLIPGSAEGISLLNEKGIKVIVATNQAGVAKGYFKEELIIECNERLKKMLFILGAHLDAIYYCPHHPDVGSPPYRLDCDCRKPKPGMLLNAQKKFNIDLKKSYVIGDKRSDLELAFSVNAHPLLVLTGYGSGELKNREKWKFEPEGVFPNLFCAINYILKKEF